MTAVIQRPLRGSRISSFYPVKSLPSLSSLDSAFQLQEYISLLIRLDVHDVDTIVAVPGKKDKNEQEGEDLKAEEKEAERERKSEIAVDEACWIYEQLRRLAQDLSHPLITMLQQECTRASCPEMKAGEWLYLCVAHGNDGAMEQCCAIDYILHTLDSATALLNSPRAFPSRLQIPQASHRHFSSLARRLGRIFAHAYFHHREAFEQAEVESSLYARFLALTSKFDLVPSEFLVIPTSRLNLNDGEGGRHDIEVEPPRLLAASVDRQHSQAPEIQEPEQMGQFEGDWEKANESVDHNNNPPGLGNASPARDQSPRRYGRNRTDTMVFSEAFNVAEDLSKNDEREGEGQSNDQQHQADVVASADGSTAEAVLEAPPPPASASAPEPSPEEHINSTSEIIVSLDEPSDFQLPVESTPSEVKSEVDSPVETTTQAPAPLPETTTEIKLSTPASAIVTADTPETPEPVAEGASTHEPVDAVEPEPKAEPTPVSVPEEPAAPAPEASEPQPTTEPESTVVPIDAAEPEPAPADEEKAEEAAPVPETDSTPSEPAEEFTVEKTAVGEEVEKAEEKAEPAAAAPSAEPENVPESAS